MNSILMALALLAVGSQSRTMITLAAGKAQLDVDGDTGTIAALRTGTGIELRSPAGQAESFRLTLLKPDKAQLTILGRNQKPTRIARNADGLELRWDGPLTDTVGTAHDIAVNLRVEPDSDGFRFTLRLSNRTGYKVQEARYPVIGGLNRLGNDAKLWIPTSNPWEASPQTASFGYPGQMAMSFACIQSKSAKRSLFVSSQDIIARYKQYRFDEQPPGNLTASIIHMPFTPPGGTFEGSPVVVRFVDGGWRECGRIYRQWFERAFGVEKPADCWIRNESFFEMTMFMLPEGTINLRFKDIPKWAKAAKDVGINSVQISGWQMGGHDNGYPDYTPDPRLGTWKELEDGIKACHKMGMKVDFFVNYQQAMVESDWYKNELHKYREMTADGGFTWYTGWGMGTLWARMGHPKNMTWLDLSFPQYRKYIVSYFAKLAEIGADGVHVDKMFPTAIEYNPDVKMSPDTAAWEGSIQLTKEVMAACRKFQPHWAMSFECNWDRLLQFTDATWWVGNQLITRQVFPEHAETLGLYDAWDFLKVNNAVRDGHIVMVGLLGFSRPTDWAPFRDLGKYIKEVKRICDSLQETVFLGEVMGHAGVKLQQDPPAGVEYNVFRNRRTGRRVLVATNSGMSSADIRITRFESGPNWMQIHTPQGASGWAQWPVTVRVPGERMVFVEQTPTPKFVVTDSDYRPDGFFPLLTRSDKGSAPSASSAPLNGDFESGDFRGWKADPCWVIADDSRGYYSGWRGKHWAWSGGNGEPATGRLTSDPFVLQRDGVKLLISGWNSLSGSGKPRKWNYVTLNLADGTELDRVYAPNTTAFVPAFLDGSSHKGKKVYVQAVDDADEKTYSMLCVDAVRQADLPAYFKQPLSKLPAFDPTKSLKLENDAYLLEFSLKNGSLTRMRDKRRGQELIREPRMGQSFKFALPIPGKEPWQTIEANWIFGRNQTLSSFSVKDGVLTLKWDGPLKNYLGRPYDVSVRETVELGPDGPVFSLAVRNRTGLPVGETYFPIVGGIQGLGSTRLQLKATEMIRPLKDDAFASADIFRVFNNFFWLGDQGPEQWYSFPEDQPEPWVGFACGKTGGAVCLGRQSAGKTVIRLELVPSSSGTTREDGNWPRPSELHGLPVGVELSFVDVAGVPAGKDYVAAPVFLRYLNGGAAELSKAFRERWTKGSSAP